MRSVIQEEGVSVIKIDASGTFRCAGRDSLRPGGDRNDETREQNHDHVRPVTQNNYSRDPVASESVLADGVSLSEPEVRSVSLPAG